MTQAEPVERRPDSGSALAGRRTLLIVENLSVPTDRRVWQEALALRRAGMEVVVLCPAGDKRDSEPFELRDGIEIHRYGLRQATGPLGYVSEFASAALCIRRATLALARSRPFDVVHAANPPDLLLPAVRTLKRDGTRFVFDHHDLAPELYRSRFDRVRDPIYVALRALERLSFALADVVISTNESYRRIAVERGRKDPRDVFVVRNSPDLDLFRRVAPDPTFKRGKRHLIAYLGAIAPQDGVDHALRALAALRQSRDDWHAILMGDGPGLAALAEQRRRLGLGDCVELTGWTDADVFLPVLSSADVCLSPEPPSPLNDASTMIKVSEYMALGSACVAYDLPETRATAGEAALYARPGDPESLAAEIGRLLDDAELRLQLGAAAKARIRDHLSWGRSVGELVRAYARALARLPT